MTNLLVPVFIWNGAPVHNITALIGVPSQSKIVTGSSTGTLCIWGTNFKENKVCIHQKSEFSVLEVELKFFLD
jgi:hypothetical protein